MENRIYKSFIFYNEEGLRLGIFGQIVDNNLKITIIPCSKRDQFSRKQAKIEFAQTSGLNEEELLKKHVEVIILPIEDVNPGRTFYNWCRGTYFKLFTTPVTIDYKYLSKSRIPVFIQKLSGDFSKIKVSKKLKIYNLNESESTNKEATS